MYYLGIDFGTSFTKAAVYSTDTQGYYAVKLGNAGVQRNDGRIPTVAFFQNEENVPKIGDEAVNGKKMPNGEFIYNFKPELDTLSDEKSDRRNKLSIVIVEFFKHVKACAELQFNQTFKDVVITVPASAPKGGVRYQIMRTAAKKAGFEDILMIPEPVAAAYYLLEDRIHSTELNNSTYLIYDFGGGTFDTSVITISDQQIQVIDESVGSDNEQKWGGIYIDSLVGMDYIKKCKYAQDLVRTLRDNSKPYGLRMDASDHIQDEPIKAKEALTKDEIYANPFGYSLTREDFESFIQEMVNNTIQCTLSLINSAEKEKLCDGIHSVKTVFLVGGTSQIPLVSKRWHFQKTSLKASFDIETRPELNIVALGASRYRDLKLSPNQLNEKGIEKAKEGDYKKAAAYFNNAGDLESLYWMGVLYYIGGIGRKRKPTKAFQLFMQSNLFDESKLMMALMKFKGDGVKKNDNQSKLLISKLPDSKLKASLERAIENNYDDIDLNTIYGFDAKTLFASSRPKSSDLPSLKSLLLKPTNFDINSLNSKMLGALGLGLFATIMMSKKNDNNNV